MRSMLNIREHGSICQIDDVKRKDPCNGGQEGKAKKLDRGKDGPCKLQSRDEVPVDLLPQGVPVKRGVQNGEHAEKHEEPSGGGEQLVDGELCEEGGRAGGGREVALEVCVEVVEEGCS